MPIPFSEAQQPAPSALIELFELQLITAIHGVDTIYRFHAGINAKQDGDVIWAGNSYLAFPISAEGFSYSGNGQLPRPTVKVSNVLGTITALLLSLPSGLEGAKFTRIRTHARYLDAVNFTGNVNPYGTPDPTAEYPREIYYVDRRKIETREVVEFELAAAFDLAGVRIPKRQCIASICQWKYRSAECSYTGNAYFDANGAAVSTLGLDVCGKKLSDCQLRLAQRSVLGSVTLGSSVLVLDAATSLETGAPVGGYGVPAGTTAANVSGTSLTMSAAATATSVASKTGTLQTNRTQIIVANTTGLAVGMVVSGTKIPAGTTIASISGTTINLGQPVRLIDIVQVATTKSGYLVVQNQPLGLPTTIKASNTMAISSTSGISVGMYVSGPTVSIDLASQVTEVASVYSGIKMSYVGLVAGSNGTYTFYTMQTQTSQTYTFTSPSRVYTFRADNGIPFGSFPGIGTYFS